MRREALATAFCIATDATGILVQPTPHPDKKRQPCRGAPPHRKAQKWISQTGQRAAVIDRRGAVRLP